MYNNYITSIIANQVNTFKRYDTKKLRWIRMLTHFLLPAIISYSIVAFLCSENKFGDTYLNAFSIFIGLLLNLLVLIFSVYKKDGLTRAEKTTLKNLTANIIFGIFISIVSVILIIAYQVLTEGLKVYTLYVLYYFLILFILDLFLILERFTTLIVVDLNKKN